ncbi:MAG: 50S ribosomal protein L31 [Verrucomicrobiota bacterium]|nr:50S ribosomal protein L31 [Verrucomicrobiota bacterium]
MKDIHPDYKESQVSCACGHVFKTRSTRQNLRLGICAACHPFFTGTQKFVDTAGRIEKFARRFGSSSIKSKASENKATEAKDAEKKA